MFCSTETVHCKITKQPEPDISNVNVRQLNSLLSTILIRTLNSWMNTQVIIFYWLFIKWFTLTERFFFFFKWSKILVVHCFIEKIWRNQVQVVLSVKHQSISCLLLPGEEEKTWYSQNLCFLIGAHSHHVPKGEFLKQNLNWSYKCHFLMYFHLVLTVLLICYFVYQWCTLRPPVCRLLALCLF